METLNPTSPARLQKINPATGELLAEYPVADAQAVTNSVAVARQSAMAWQSTSLRERQQVLKSLVRLIHQDANTLAGLISSEVGKPLKDAYEADITTSVNVLHHYAALGPKMLGERRLPPDIVSLIMGRLHVERHLPMGVVGVISPWNYPLAIATSGIATALMGGNSVLLKPSELTPGVGERLVMLFRQALKENGHSPDTVQLLQGDGATGAALVDSDIDFMIFTGSSAVGRKIQQAMSARGKGVSLELGSSDPAIVLDGADLDAASSAILWGRFTNAGQACAAAKRVFVPARHMECFTQLLQAKISQLWVGNPEDPGVHLGPLVSERQLQLLEAQVRAAQAAGARVVVGGKRMERPGFFYEPTLLVDVAKDCNLLQEEVFGPVLPLVPYDTLDDAVRMANATPYGLTASVFGPPKEARKLADRLEAGTVVINDVGPLNYAIPAAPWSGWKQSGPGSSHGTDSLLEVTRTQTLSVNLLSQLPLFRKAPWLFGKEPDLRFSKAFLDMFAADGLPAKLSPRFYRELLRNRSDSKI